MGDLQFLQNQVGGKKNSVADKGPSKHKSPARA